MNKFDPNTPNVTTNRLPSAEPQPKKSVEEMKQDRDIAYIFKSSKEEVKEGPIDQDAAQIIAKKLNDVSQQHGIRFDENKLKDMLKGGACTAVTLTFIDNFFRGMEKLGAKGEITTEDILEIIRGFADEKTDADPHEDPKLAIRTFQAALNTIEVSDKQGLDSKTKKIQSLVASKDLNVASRSTSYHIDEDEHNIIIENEREFNAEIRNLPNGVYLLRGIKPKDNEKMEDFGHSTAFIHLDDCAFFFDPNQGVCFLPSRGSEITELKEQMATQYDDWGLSVFRFYKLDPNDNLEEANLSSSRALLLMNYKQNLSPESVNKLTDDQVNILLNKNVKQIVKRNIADIDEISQIGKDTFDEIANSKFFGNICREFEGLGFKLEDLLKIASFTKEQLNVLRPRPSRPGEKEYSPIIDMIKNKEIGVDGIDHFIDVYEQVMDIVPHELALQKTFCKLALKNIADLDEIYDLSEKQGQLLKDQGFAKLILDGKIAFSDFLEFSDETLSLLAHESAMDHTNKMFPNIGILMEYKLLTADQLSRMNEHHLNLMSETEFIDLFLREAGEPILIDMETFLQNKYVYLKEEDFEKIAEERPETYYKKGSGEIMLRPEA